MCKCQQLFDIIGLLVLVPVFLGVLAYSLAGRLDPGAGCKTKTNRSGSKVGHINAKDDSSRQSTTLSACMADCLDLVNQSMSSDLIP